MPTPDDRDAGGPSLPTWLAERGFATTAYADIALILPPACAVPAGHFMMGRDPARDLPDPKGREPQHAVWVEGFALGRFPVTVAEYACFVAAGGPRPEPHGRTVDWSSQLGRPEHPVVRVTWDQAVAYAHWLADLTGQPWRLPTEAEWEKAARWDDAARRPRVYPWGDRFDRLRANTRDHGPGATTAVGSYPGGASPCGALDVAGNVWEWTSSYALPYPYDARDGRESAGTGPAGAYYRIRRGGAWDRTWHDARCAHRNLDVPFLNSDAQGFRLARGTDIAGIAR
jgi:formylglycine-generating enzyme required for sulfatase activity